MSIKHGTIAAPTGINLTGCLIHELRTSEEDVVIEVMDSDGSFEDGKSIRKKTSYGLTGECLSTVSLPSAGVGDASASSPHVDRVETTEKNEGAQSFSLDAHVFADGAGDYAAVV